MARYNRGTDRPLGRLLKHSDEVDGASMKLKTVAAVSAARAGTITGTASLLVIACSTWSMAAPHCMTRILADVPAEEAPEQVKSKSNGEFGPVTKIKVNKKTGKMIYCAEGTYCYNSNAFELTTPCRVKLDKVGDFGDYFIYFTR